MRAVTLAIRPWASVCAIVALCWGWCAPIRAQDVTEVTLKGALLFNFVRFATWPPESAPSSHLSACIIGDHAVGQAFAKAAGGRAIDGRTLQVTIIEPEVAPPFCHFLYISGVPRERVTAILTTVREAPVLTVSDLEGFASIGGIVEVFIDAGRMKFRVNPQSARRARVQISSRLLALAELVDAPPTSPPEPRTRGGLIPRANHDRSIHSGIGVRDDGDPLSVGRGR
jgi:uncharacterized protein DUF4154